jgi:hypothetical protein
MLKSVKLATPDVAFLLVVPLSVLRIWGSEAARRERE